MIFPLLITSKSIHVSAAMKKVHQNAQCRIVFNLTFSCDCYKSGDSSSTRYLTSIHSSWFKHSNTIQSDNHVISCSIEPSITTSRWNNSSIRMVPLSSACSIRIIYSPTAGGVISVTLQSTTISDLSSFKTFSNQPDINDIVVSIYCCV